MRLAVNAWNTLGVHGLVDYMLHLPSRRGSQALDPRHCLATRSAWRSGLLLAGPRRTSSDDEWPDPTVAQQWCHVSISVEDNVLKLGANVLKLGSL